MAVIGVRSLSLSAAFIGATSMMVGCGMPEQTRMVRSTLQTPNGVVTYMTSVETGASDKIIGTNELTPVLKDGASLPEIYRPYIDAFGLISMGCSATHIGNGLVLTAGHCFDAPATRTDHQSCSGVTVKWGLRKDKTEYLVSKCVEILSYEQNDDRDYAIFKVDNVPTATVPYDLSARAADDTKITIFGHPQARPLEWSQYCTVQPSSNGPWGADHFAHQCDTEPGNSGSTVIADSSGKIIGIHDGGRAPWNYATYLFDTPLAEFINGDKPVPTPAPVPGDEADRVFGPFGSNVTQDLTTLEKEKGNLVSFVLEFDTEKNYDNVFVSEANKSERKYTGKGKIALKGLQTPVKIRISSDFSVDSKLVAVRNITFTK